MPDHWPATTQLPCPNSADLRVGDVVWPRDPKVHTVGGEDLSDDFLKWLVSKLRTLAVGDDSELPGLPTAAGLDAWVSPHGFNASFRSSILDVAWLLLAIRQGRPSQKGDGGGAAVQDGRSGHFGGDILKKATLGGLYVGHVGMIDVDAQGQRWVIESSYVAGGVHVLRWEAWVAHRMALGAQIWVGRMQDEEGLPLDSARCRKMLDCAHQLRMERKQYAILDRASTGKGVAPLGDLTYVYCAELVWICAKSVDIDLDSRQAWARWLPMLGPKALTQSPSMRMINRPEGQDY